MSWADDIADLNSEVIDGFGEPVTYQAAGVESPVTISVIWSEGQAVAQTNPGIRAIAFAPLSSFASVPQKDDTIIRAGKMYKVAFDVAADWYDRAGGIHLPLRYMQAAP